MNEPRPFGRVSSIRVPASKEHEYGTDAQGNPIHLTYGQDEELPGVVLPSAKHFRAGGGSPGFNVEDDAVQQNIVVMNEAGFQVVRQTTRAEMAGSANRRINAPAAAQVVDKNRQLYGSIDSVVGEEGWTMGKKKVRQKKEKKAPKQRIQHDPTLERAQPKSNAVPVQITGPFGTTVQHFTALVRDGICLVLIQDHRELDSVYMLPKPQADEPMALTLEWADQRVQCFWAGIGWTMPDNSATFTVLLVAEEAHGKGLSG